jgi:hypothetical protein
MPQLLVISYTGVKHGRIIQADYDGKKLNIQFSQLWSFETTETAPVELFCRYNLPRTVGLELPVRTLSERKKLSLNNTASPNEKRNA